MKSGSPAYDLTLIHQIVRAQQYQITGTALNGASELGLDEEDVVRCGFELYVKLQIVGRDPANVLVVISFKRR